MNAQLENKVMAKIIKKLVNRAVKAMVLDEQLTHEDVVILLNRLQDLHIMLEAYFHYTLKDPSYIF